MTQTLNAPSIWNKTPAFRSLWGLNKRTAPLTIFCALWIGSVMLLSFIRSISKVSGHLSWISHVATTVLVLHFNIPTSANVWLRFNEIPLKWKEHCATNWNGNRYSGKAVMWLMTAISRSSTVADSNTFSGNTCFWLWTKIWNLSDAFNNSITKMEEHQQQ